MSYCLIAEPVAVEKLMGMVDGRISAGDYIAPHSFSTWRPGEKVPEGEIYPDTD